MNKVHDKLISFLNYHGVNYSLFQHISCRSSAESLLARTQAGYPNAVGAKALIIQIKQTKKFSLIVAPGVQKIDNKLIRTSVGSCRFATEEEVLIATDGLEIGTIPPFGKPILPGIDNLIIFSSLMEWGQLGFNAAHLNHSVVMDVKDYFRINADARVL